MSEPPISPRAVRVRLLVAVIAFIAGIAAVVVVIDLVRGVLS